jgi:glutamate dehydrogenase (NAD(P)+)
VSRAAGWLVIDTMSTGAAFGGVRVHPGLRWTELAYLSRLGTLRYQLAKVPLSGARAGLDYSPTAPDFDDVLGRFLSALRPFLSSSLGIGPDANVDGARLDGILAARNLPWRMDAIHRFQGWPRERWQTYLDLMAQRVGESTLRDIQVARSVAEAVSAAGEVLFRHTQTVAVLGQGPLGIEIARQLVILGQKVVAVGGDTGVHDESGFDPKGLAGLPELPSKHALYITPDEFWGLQVDSMVLASRPGVLNIDNVGRLRCLLVVEAAARSVDPNAEKVLFARSTPVFPSFAATVGSVLLTDGILSGASTSVEHALSQLSQGVRTTARELLRLSPTLRISVREAGVRLAFHRWGQSTLTVPLASLPEQPRHEETPEAMS